MVVEFDCTNCLLVDTDKVFFHCGTPFTSSGLYLKTLYLKKSYVKSVVTEIKFFKNHHFLSKEERK